MRYNLINQITHRVIFSINLEANMATTKKNETEEIDDTIKESVYDLSRKVLLAAVGAAAIAQDEIDGFVTHLTERGELAEKDARGLLKEVLERRDKIMRERHAEFNKHHPKAATKADVDVLTAKIAELSKQIEELKKS
jgi:polyhydroxyalkanoate synthesis regulator phasin